jgi:hypothetical protein
MPQELRQQVIELARGLRETYPALFAAPRFKRTLGRLFMSELPPQRCPGRPGHPTVTQAQRLLDEQRRLHPAEPYRLLWQRIYHGGATGRSATTPRQGAMASTGSQTRRDTEN